MVRTEASRQQPALTHPVCEWTTLEVGPSALARPLDDCRPRQDLDYHERTWDQNPQAAASAAKSLQSCPTLCDPIDGSPPGSPVPEILQARTLEWVAISFSNAWKWKVKVKLLSHVRLLATSWTTACEAPLSMGFSRQEYWSGVLLPSLNRQAKFSQRLDPQKLGKTISICDNFKLTVINYTATDN